MSRHAVHQVIRDIADLARIADKIAAAGREKFNDDGDGEILRKAARQVVTDLATAVTRLDDEVKGRHPDIPWRDILATRNYVAHAYDHVNDDVIWAAVNGEIQAVADALAEYRANE